MPLDKSSSKSAVDIEKALPSNDSVHVVVPMPEDGANISQEKDVSPQNGPDRSNESQNNKKSRLVLINYTQREKFCRNYITTAKYSFLTFIPYFFYEQFRRYSNVFFLFIALLQQIPDVSPTGRFTTLIPFVAILGVSALKEIVEDVRRHRADKETNNRLVDVMHNGEFRQKKWQDVKVGEAVRITADRFFPADIVLVSSSGPMGICYIETANLDGETNLKVRQALPQTTGLVDPRDLMDAKGFIECGLPDKHLYEFAGSIKLETEDESLPLGPEQLLLRGAVLRNTKWIYGYVVYTGHETKLMKNTTKPPLKRSTLDRLTNYQTVMLFILLVAISLISAYFSEFYMDPSILEVYVGKSSGLAEDSKAGRFFYNFLTFLILYNNLIPISLTVTLECVRLNQALFINWDEDMYHFESDTEAVARTSNLNEELGQIRYIFSDKTGTLTRNVMEFKGCSVAGIYYAPDTLFPKSEEEESPLIQDLNKSGNPKATNIREFLVLLAVCHNVVPEIKISDNGLPEELLYHAASPDEQALAEGARDFGFIFLNRTPTFVEISVFGTIERYEILNLIEFTSSRKRMTVVVRCPDKSIKVYCKGADSVIYERLSQKTEHDQIKNITQGHLDRFASTGLRTLCCAMKLLTKKEHADWNAKFHKAASAINDREESINRVAELIENNLELLGATAIEDKLQDFVPETIAAFLEAGISVWVLTGDKQETAINIGYSCRLLTKSMTILMINQETENDTLDCINAYADELHINLNSFKKKKSIRDIQTFDVAVVIDGKTLSFALQDKLRRPFTCLCCSCRAVIVCRASPLQKAEIVELVTELTGAVTLAIGDGANDVAMIQKANVGVGISGNEGLQAASSSDYAIAQFYFLKKLLFVHGAWSHDRIAKTVFYSFYKNICLYIIELWFAIYSAWSGQVIYERWTIGCYNMLFTALQPIAIGLFERNCSMKLRMENPILYHTSILGTFNLKRFFLWIFNSLLHSVCIFWLTFYLTGRGIVWKEGKEAGFLVEGNYVYTYVVIVVSLKAGLETKSWTKYTHIAIWGSILLWLLFFTVYSYMWQFSSLGSEIYDVAEQVFTSVPFWIGCVVVPVATLLPDVIFKAVRGTWFKTIPDQYREEEITGIKIRHPGTNSVDPNLTEAIEGELPNEENPPAIDTADESKDTNVIKKEDVPLKEVPSSTRTTKGSKKPTLLLTNKEADGEPSVETDDEPEPTRPKVLNYDPAKKAVSRTSLSEAFLTPEGKDGDEIQLKSVDEDVTINEKFDAEPEKENSEVPTTSSDPDDNKTNEAQTETGDARYCSFCGPPPPDK